MTTSPAPIEPTEPAELEVPEVISEMDASPQPAEESLAEELTVEDFAEASEVEPIRTQAHLGTTRERMAVGRALLALMQDLSEAIWGEEWEREHEYQLWRAGEEAMPASEIRLEHEARASRSTPEPADLRTLAELCGGWWVWREGPMFVELEQWQELYTLWRNVLMDEAESLPAVEDE